MSTQRGIFDSTPSQSPSQGSPFTVVPEPANPFSPSPFSAAPVDSPFSAAPESPDPSHKPKLPERRKPVESPFHLADPQEGFGMEPAQGFATPRPETHPSHAQPAAPPSPFDPPPSSPFAPSSSPFAPSSTPFGGDHASTPPSQPQPAQGGTPYPPPPAYASAPSSEQYGAGNHPQSQSDSSDSSSIRQLELRAIFGVDREMNADEILQRTRALPGVRNIARVAPHDMATVDSIKTLIANLGFGNGPIRLYSGSVPLEFIREGNTLLAVQTDGGFAPGVRETLMIVARQLGRM